MDTLFKERIAIALAYLGQVPRSVDEMPIASEGFNNPELGALFELGTGQPRVVLDEAIEMLMPGLDSPSIYQASRLAPIIGTFVEWGASPDIALGRVIARLEPQLVTVRRFVKEFGAQPSNLTQAFAKSPDDFPACRGLDYMGVAAMTMLARSVDGRIAARQRTALVEAAEALADEIDICWYLSQVFDMVDDLKMLVIDLEKREGWIARLTAVRSNFHLLTLLQCALGISESPADICAMAKGQIGGLDEEASDAAAYSYFSWTAMSADGAINPLGLIWGEMSPLEIPRIDDMPIVLMGSGGPQRMWDVSFFYPLHDALRSGVEIGQTLTPAEVDAWLARIRSARRE